jgi:Leu/Phe-tRNA-protein transferase
MNGNILFLWLSDKLKIDRSEKIFQRADYFRVRSITACATMVHYCAGTGETQETCTFHELDS